MEVKEVVFCRMVVVAGWWKGGSLMWLWWSQSNDYIANDV